MSSAWLSLTGLLVLIIPAVAVAADDRASPLHINPFVQPAPAAPVSNQDKDVEDTRMDVRGVVLAGENSLANIGGKIVSIGQDINGYRLVAVQENRVVLDRDGVRRELGVRTKD